MLISQFSNNENRLHLSILPTVRDDTVRSCDRPEIAKIVIGELILCLFEEIFWTCNKCGLGANLMDTVVMNIESLVRAGDFVVGHVECVDTTMDLDIFLKRSL